MLTLITVNFNGAGRTIELLRCLERQTDKDFEVLVVDNASEPDDRALLGQYATTGALNLDLILSDTNRGFAGGNNLAIRKAMQQGSVWFVLINNDTTVADDFVARLRPRLMADAPFMTIPLKEGHRTAYAGLVRWLAATLPHAYEPGCAHNKSFAPRLYAIGAGMAVHRSVFERIGLLEKRYFLYFEDADFSLRARAAGIGLTVLATPVITHAVSASTSRLGSPLLLRYHMRNALEFNRLHGPWWVKISLHFWAFFAILKQLIKMLLMPARRPQSRAIAAGIIDFYAKRFGQLPPRDHRPGMRGA